MAGARKRICFVLPSLAGGGAERAAVQVLNALDETVWDRSMFLFSREGPYLSDVLASVRIDAADSSSRLGRWLALRRYIRRTRPDVVMSFLSYFTVLTAAKAAGVGARVVFNQQTPMSAFLADGDYHWRRRWDRSLFTLATRIGYAAADLIITTSQGVADDLVSAFGVASARVRVVHNPVDLETVRARATEAIEPSHEAVWERPVIVAAGRLAEAKNYPLLIEAMAILRSRMPARLFILGEGDQEAAIRSLVAARGLDGSVILCGFERNPWRYLARADVFALTSVYEGFGNVLVEAMACSVPVVATSSPGTRAIVRTGIDGLLVDRHEPAAVASALERVLGDAPFRCRLKEGARQGAERFALPVIVAAYDRVLQGALV
jgi:glycosyltransferase involved in cell wall biosynthesis